MLLESPPHVATVFPEEEIVDSYENRVKRPSANGVVVRCLITSRSTSRDAESSRVGSELQIIAKDAPLSEFARVEFDGKKFSVTDVRRSNVNEQTRHVTAILREET